MLARDFKAFKQEQSARISYTRPTNRNCACPLRSVLKVECAACVVAF